MFPQIFILISFSLNLVYQFFLHTEIVGQLPLIEGWLNTPSAHRVHHGSNPKYIDKNYADLSSKPMSLEKVSELKH